MKKILNLCTLSALAFFAVSAIAPAAKAKTTLLGDEPAYSYEMLENAILNDKRAEEDTAVEEDTAAEANAAAADEADAAVEENTADEADAAAVVETDDPPAEEDMLSLSDTVTTIDTFSRSDTVAISANVALSGSGTGYHAKLVIGTADAAVSFGLQFDEYAVSPYAGCTAFLVENVLSEYEQQYTRFEYNGSPYALQYTPYYLTLAVSTTTGEVRVYVFDQLVGTVTNPNLAGQHLYAWVEGAARINGDYVTAQFENVRVLENGKVYKKPQVSYVQLADGIYTDITVDSRPSSIIVSGELLSLDYSYDWDSAPTSVNGYVRFY